MMAFPAMLSELFDALRRKVGTDKRPARVVPEPSWWHRIRAASRPQAVIEDTRFRRIDGKFDALSHTMDQRFDALSQRFDVLNEPFVGLSRAMDKRFDALMDKRFYALNHAMDQRFGEFGHAMDQRSDVLTRAMDQRFGEFGQVMGQRFDALGRMIGDRFAGMDQQFVARDARLVRLETKTAQIAEMDVWLKRLETKTATEFRYLRWGLGIVIALVLGLVTKVILDWLDSPILSLFGRAINAIHF